MRAIALMLLATSLVLATAPARAQDVGESDAAETDGDAAEPTATVADEEEDGEEADESEATTDDAPEPVTAPAETVTRRPDEAAPPSTSASGVLGVITLLGAVGTAAGIGTWLERQDNLDVCQRYAMEDPPTLGCLNTSAIRDQRDVGIGLTIGFGTVMVGAAIAWALVLATTPAPPSDVSITCAPGLLSVACAGRF